MELSNNIGRLRGERGMSQEELAAKLGVSRQSVSKWETGAATPELEKVAALAELFGVSLDELVLGVEGTEKDTTPEGGGAERAQGTYAAPHRRFVAGVALLCTGAALAILLFLLGGGLWGLVYASPLLLCGLVCLKARRHVGFWCFAATYLPVLWYIKWGTGVSQADLHFWAPYNNPMRGIIYIALLGCSIGLIVCGMRSFRDTEPRSRRPWLRLGLCAALYAAAYFLRTPLYMLAGSIDAQALLGSALMRAFDVARYALLAYILIYGSVALRRGGAAGGGEG